MLTTLFYFFIALLLLILIHEFGHFIVARSFGVKVLRFSFGFGKVLFRLRDKKDTEYVFSLVPLGGYVKMLDETEGDVPKEERHRAFNNQTVWVKIAIVVAGPLFNFLFAFLALWLMWLIGIKSLAPIIMNVQPHSIAARAGLQDNQEIIQLNDDKIYSWRDFQYALMPLIGTNEAFTMTVKNLDNDNTSTLSFRVDDWQLDSNRPDVLASLGIIPFVPTISPIVGFVMQDSPAERAGIQVGDEIVAMNDRAVDDWLRLVEYIKERPDQYVLLTIIRQKNIQAILVKTGHILHDKTVEGFMGVKSQEVNWPRHWVRTHRASLFLAAGKAFNQTIELTEMTFILIGRLIMGKLPIHSISGPIGIAQGAGESGRSGLPYYLFFLALVSISLGVLNLLPIPMLDGGHLLFFVIELLTRRKLSEAAKSAGMCIGLVLLVALMFVALSNDLTRLMG